MPFAAHGALGLLAPLLLRLLALLRLAVALCTLALCALDRLLSTTALLGALQLLGAIAFCAPLLDIPTLLRGAPLGTRHGCWTLRAGSLDGCGTLRGGARGWPLHLRLRSPRLLGCRALRLRSFRLGRRALRLRRRALLLLLVGLLG